MTEGVQNKFKQQTRTRLKEDKYICNVQEAYEDFPGRDLITKKDFIKIIRSFFLILLEEIVNTGIGYKIPYGLGIFGVQKVVNKRFLGVD